MQEEVFTGEKLREMRQKFGMTQEDLSKETGIGRSRLSSYENGDRISKSIALLLKLYFEKKSNLF